MVKPVQLDVDSAPISDSVSSVSTVGEEASKAYQLLSVEEMREKMSFEKQKRVMMSEYIATQMKEGVDFGKIHVFPKEKCGIFGCMNQGHMSKNVLFKPGAEKFCSLFQLRGSFEKDAETWEMLGSQNGVVCYICKLFNGEVLVGEGRGVCSVAEKFGQLNNAVKIAEKRAKIDAVLSTGGLSDFFTQNLEDANGEIAAGKNTAPGKENGAPQIINGKKATEKQVKFLKTLIAQTNFDIGPGLEKYGYKDITELTVTQAKSLIENLLVRPQNFIDQTDDGEVTEQEVLSAVDSSIKEKYEKELDVILNEKLNAKTVYRLNALKIKISKEEFVGKEEILKKINENLIMVTQK